jgi:hypothetical protein
MTTATEMYYTGYDPYTMEPVFTAKTQKEKLAQRQYFFWYKDAPQSSRKANQQPSRKDSNDIALILQKNFPNWKRSSNLRFPGYGPQKAWVREENDIILIP